jgi:hypothetical protein
MDQSQSIGEIDQDRQDGSLAQVSIQSFPNVTFILTILTHDRRQLLTASHTCEHLLVAVKVPPSHPKDAPIPWDTDPILRSLRKGIDTDVVVAEVRETSRKPDEVYGVIER